MLNLSYSKDIHFLSQALEVEKPTLKTEYGINLSSNNVAEQYPGQISKATFGHAPPSRFESCQPPTLLGNAPNYPVFNVVRMALF